MDNQIVVFALHRHHEYHMFEREGLPRADTKREVLERIHSMVNGGHSRISRIRPGMTEEEATAVRVGLRDMIDKWRDLSLDAGKVPAGEWDEFWVSRIDG